MQADSACRPAAPDRRQGKTPRAESESAAIRKACVLLRKLAFSCGNLRKLAECLTISICHVSPLSQQPVYTPPFGLHRLPFCAIRRPSGPDSAQGLDFAGFRLSECGRYTYRPVRDRYPGFSATPRHRGTGEHIAAHSPLSLHILSQSTAPQPRRQLRRSLTALLCRIAQVHGYAYIRRVYAVNTDA